MKRNLWFIILFISFSSSWGCNSGGCPPTNGATNGTTYIIVDANGQQVSGPKGQVTAANGQVQIPCGGSAHPTDGGAIIMQNEH